MAIEPSEYADRVERVRARLAERSLDAVLITHPTNRRYLTGFTADDIPPNESGGHLLITPDAAILITGAVNITQAEAQSPHITVVKRETGWSEDDAAQIKEQGPARIAYEPMAMLDGVLRGINAKLAEDNITIEWVDADGLVEELRAVKSPAEVRLIRRAFEITNEAFNEVAAEIAAGQSEREIAWRFHAAMVARGAEGPSFPIIVAAGEHAARPHHEPAERLIAPGEPIVIDMGARYEGYCADLTRTVWVGAPDKRLREIYPVVEGAVEAVLERLMPAVDGKELDTSARDHIDARGHGEAFVHGLGHGVGLRVHESPSASKTSEDRLLPGHTLTIEPGVYYPEWGGVRIEDVVLVTEGGFEVLTSGATKLHID